MPNTFTDYTWTQSEARLVANSLLDSNGNVTYNECHMPYTNKTSENFTIAVNLVRWKVFLNPTGTPAPVANFSGTPTSGAYPLAVSFTDSSTNTPDRVVLDVRRLQHLHRPESVAHLRGGRSFTVALTATNSGGNNTCTKSNYITVTSPAPVANFSGTPTSGYLPLIVNFTDSSTNNPTSWSWNFGDTNVPYNTSTVQNPTKWYIDAGTYTVSLTVTNAYGNDTMTRTNYCTSSVNPAAPTPNFSATPTSGSAPLTVQFTDQSTGSGLCWDWRFGDGGRSNSQNPSHTYTSPGSYTVALYIHNGPCNNLYKTNYITVTPPAPVANFSGTPTSGAKPLSVTFTDSSTNSPTAWSWNFGDSSTSTVQNPSHSYVNAGTYTVALTATNAYGNNTNTKTNYITVTGSIPTFVAAGAVAYGTGAITPALPSGIATNDILLLFLDTSNQTITIPTPNGGTWTQVTNSPQGTGTGGSSGSVALTVFWSRYNGTQGAPTTSDSGDHQIGRIIAIRGATTSGNPWDVTAGGVDATASTTATIPGATTTVANTLVVVAAAVGLPNSNGTANFSAWTNANLSSIAERIDNTRNAGVGGGIGVATGGKATAGAYGNTTVTLAASAKKAMLSLAIKP